MRAPIQVGYVFAMLFVFALCGCAHPLCQVHRDASLPQGLDGPEKITTAQWAMLLLRGPGYTCVGEPTLPPRLRDLQPLERARHVWVADAAGPKRHLVWLQTHGDADGVYGPVAVVVQSSGTLRVEALGTLMLPRGRVKMSIAPLGSGRALWATTTACRPDVTLAQSLCRTQMQVMPWIGDRLIMPQENQFFDLNRQEAQPLVAGWRRLIEHRAELTDQGGTLVLQEHLAIREVAGRNSQIPARHRRELQGRRTMAFNPKTGWQASGPALWARSQANTAAGP